MTRPAKDAVPAASLAAGDAFHIKGFGLEAGVSDAFATQHPQLTGVIVAGAGVVVLGFFAAYALLALQMLWNRIVYDNKRGNIQKPNRSR